MKNPAEKNKSKLKIWKFILALLFIILAIMLVEVRRWTKVVCGDIAFDEIVYYFMVPLEGTDSSLLPGYISRVLMDVPILIAFFAVLFVPDVLLWVHKQFGEKSIKQEEEESTTESAEAGISQDSVFHKILRVINQIRKFIIRRMLPISIVVFLIALIVDIRVYGVDTWLKSRLQSSSLYEEYYVAMDEVAITAPQEKKNLIFIMSESLEASFYRTEDGGAVEYDLLPQLTALAKENTCFSTGKNLTGSIQVTGTGWSSAAMVSYMSGVPLIVPLNDISMSKYSSVLPGISTIGEYLEEQGYYNALFYGTEKEFAATGTFFTQHGNYEIFDFNVILDEGYVDERKFWGCDDQVLFQYTKDRLVEISESGQPFNVFIKTVDLHNPDGYICDLCEDTFRNTVGGDAGRFMDIIRCQDQQIYEFVEWCKVQDFYENTVICIVGDHVGIAPVVANEIVPEEYERTPLNIIINSTIDSSNEKNREFTPMDLCPTILASMGFQIEGDRLGIGTNLYSDRPTLMEELGREKYCDELKKNSNYYNKYLAGTR